MNNVLIKSIIECKAADGRAFMVATLIGNPIVAKSASGKSYLVIPKANLPLRDVDATTAQSLIGMQLEGTISKVTVPEYKFKGRDGKQVKCSHRYEFSQS